MTRKLIASLSTFVALASISSSAFAMVCPFTDHFSIQAPLPLEIMSFQTGGNLAYAQLTPTKFDLSCKDNKTSQGGDVFMVIGMQEDLSCKFTLHDSPFEMNPTVTFMDCGGSKGRLFYLGMDHRIGSYDYTLKFTM